MEEKKPEEKAADIHVAAKHGREAVEACLPCLAAT